MPRYLISAASRDHVPGVEISDPDSPLGWHDLPTEARRWATAQGYGEAEDELLYVAESGPAGYPTYQL